MADPGPVLVLVVVAALYGLGLGRAEPPRARPWLFGAGLLATSVAVVGPLAAAAATSLTAHMVQHVILLVVAAPLLVLGRPLPVMLAALRPRWQARFRAASEPIRSGVARVPGWGLLAVAVTVKVGVMWAWHAPPLYDAAVRHGLWHGLEHVSYLGTGLLLWWAVLADGRRSVAAALGLFAAALPGTALGAALTFSGAPWYEAYRAIRDQQVAGVVMWAFGGIVYAVAAGAVVASALREDQPGGPVAAPAREEADRWAVR